jgi:uncharacterized C2H2 Zn-finger protein
MKLTLHYEEEINIDNLTISNLKEMDNQSINDLLYEIKENLEDLVKQEIIVRERTIEGKFECLYCDKVFKSNFALRIHKLRSHNINKSDDKFLFLSSHFISNFFYVLLTNKHTNHTQKVISLKLKN